MAKSKEPADAEIIIVTVKVTSQPVSEDGVHHAQGSTFQTTADRAAALGSLVEIVEG